jgi:uncharacterized protein
MNRIAGALIVLYWLATAAAAQDMGIPYLSGRVVDQAAILSAQARERLAVMVQAHERARGNQIVVLTVPTLGGKSVEDYAVRVFEEWKLGSLGKDNGVLILVVPQDRRVRLEVGYGLEGMLTDATASRIIRDLMTPRFREGNYDVGIEAGITAVIQILEGSHSAGADADWLDPEGKKTSRFHVRAPDMPLAERILIGAFVFGIVGLFTFMGLVTPGGMGWFLYFFLMPFWSMFPMFIFGSGAALKILGTYAVLYPFAKVFISRQRWNRKVREDLKNKGYAEIGGMVIRPGGGSSGYSSGGGFSGGGGRSGGGGASGSW